MGSKRINDGDKMKKIILVCTALMLFTAACQSVLETPDNFNKTMVETEHFSFLVFEKDITPGQPIRVYIEDDGTPNPTKAMGLKLAQKDPYQNVIYVARPCQYTQNQVCANKEVYTSARYNEEVVKEMKELATYLVRKHKAPSLEFVGFGGGAPMALLLSARVPEVTRVITIAGILDTEAYTTHNNLPRLTGSLNPADERNILAQMSQVHYVGGRDNITTKRMAERFVSRLQNPRSAVVKVVPSATHDSWESVQFDYY